MSALAGRRVAALSSHLGACPRSAGKVPWGGVLKTSLPDRGPRSPQAAHQCLEMGCKELAFPPLSQACVPLWKL